eukprot:scaffold53820_cov33-Tisochrysis_lutea.AAC.1
MSSRPHLPRERCIPWVGGHSLADVLVVRDSRFNTRLRPWRQAGVLYREAGGGHRPCSPACVRRTHRFSPG